MKKINTLWILPLILMGFVLMLTNSCSKDEEAQAPTVTTTAISAITQTTATSGGNITSDGGATITARGVCWSTSTNPTTTDSRTTDGTGTGSFTSNITGLTENTTYFVRAYATNSTGTAYGSTVAFTTLTLGGDATVTDLDGNVYHTVTIGSQVWTVENLKTTKYRTGDAIPNVNDNTAWSGLTTGAYCNYNNDANNATTYGRLYNWYAVNTGNLAPIGWHVASDAEWVILTDYLTNNGYGNGGSGDDIAKSMAATSGWTRDIFYGGTIGYEQTSNNSSGFTALPGGSRNNDGLFDNIEDIGCWWSSSEYNTNLAWNRALLYVYRYVDIYTSDKTNGFSVRCVKD